MAFHPGEPEPRERMKMYAFKLPPEWLEALELAAKESGTTRSRVARMAFFEYFEKRNIAV